MMYVTVLLSVPWLTLLTQLGSKPNFLHHGGLGLRRFALHSSAAYIIASVIASDCSSPQSKCLSHSMDLFNGSVSTIDAPTITTVLTSKQTQNVLSAKLEDQQFANLFANASLPDRARLLSIFSPHSSAWLSITPSPRLNLLSLKLPLSDG